eukprot:1080504-Rhodomonas_salina.2
MCPGNNVMIPCSESQRGSDDGTRCECIQSGYFQPPNSTGSREGGEEGLRVERGRGGRVEVGVERGRPGPGGGIMMSRLLGFDWIMIVHCLETESCHLHDLDGLWEPGMTI